jgi:hypothetical protein
MIAEKQNSAGLLHEATLTFLRELSRDFVDRFTNWRSKALDLESGHNRKQRLVI